jgi:DNA-binding CsgD family transcriptional regulator
VKNRMVGQVKAARKLVRSEVAPHIPIDRACGKNPAAYIFCDKKTGATKFTVDANTDGDVPLDRIAGSLAVYCVAHYCSPKDLVLVIRADETFSSRIDALAAALLQSARVGAASVALSPREREVLQAVTNNLGNKEIAYQLSISVRTVKFHVSALLAKFGVSSRAQLYDFSAARMYDVERVKPVHVAHGVS